MIWHARLCHVIFRMIHEMSKYGLVPPFNMNLEKCKTCMVTKLTKYLLPNVTRNSAILEPIHSDLCDFHSTTSLGHKRYVVTCHITS